LPSPPLKRHRCCHRSPAHSRLKLNAVADALLLCSRSSMTCLPELLPNAPLPSLCFPVAPETACSITPGCHPRPCPTPPAFDPTTAVLDSASWSLPPCLTPSELLHPYGCASTTSPVSPNCLHHPPPHNTCRNSGALLEQQKAPPPSLIAGCSTCLWKN
jgi:hypothetical protein